MGKSREIIIKNIFVPHSDELDFQSHNQHAQDIRVLIVDDHPQVRRALRVFLDVWEDLELAGEAEDGKEAIELVEQLRPDVVLMDLIMPEMDGVTATRIIRKQFPEVAVVALTSTVDYKLIDKALAAGAYNYVLKVVSLETLAEVIREAVYHR